ncbi:MAG TPA: glycosyltransferase [Acidimicrobiales bacterium]|nr:glycosyltransferase [Acidimicrobiales bacterium]
MARFLFAVPPLNGHVNPTVAVGAALTEAGHEVAWVGPPVVVAPLLPADALLLPAGEELGRDTVATVRDRATGMRGPAAFKFLWEEFLLPLARLTAPGIDRAVDEFRPDVLIADQQAIAGAIVARRRGITWVTSATTPAELSRPFEALPKVGEWVRTLLVDIQLEMGVERALAMEGDLRFSDQLILAFTTDLLMGSAAAGVPPATAFVGPALGGRPPMTDFPWEWLRDDVASVLVSLGTVNVGAGDRFFAAILQALDGLTVPMASEGGVDGEAGGVGGVSGVSGVGRPVQAIVVAPPDVLGPVPPNVLVRESVPQLELLSHLDAVVCHGGNNTVCESLLHGLPLVLAPIRDDQPIVAEQVVESGAGLRVRFGRVKAPELRAVLTAVLSEPRYREASGRVQESFRVAGGAETAARRLAALAASESRAPATA